MASPSDFEHLDIVIRRKNARYLASMPQINLYAGAESLPAALESLEQKKKALVEELAAADLLDEFKIAGSHIYVAPSPAHAVFGRPRSALGFIGKTIVIAAACVIAGFLLTRQVTASVDRMLSHQSAELRDRFASVGGAKFWVNLEKNLARAADPASDLPPAKKAELLSQIRVVAERWRPFIREASLLFSDPAPPPPAAPDQR